MKDTKQIEVESFQAAENYCKDNNVLKIGIEIIDGKYILTYEDIDSTITEIDITTKNELEKLKKLEEETIKNTLVAALFSESQRNKKVFMYISDKIVRGRYITFNRAEAKRFTLAEARKKAQYMSMNGKYEWFCMKEK